MPRHAPFPAAEELWLVRGIPPLVVEKMLPFVTVFSNLASVNILDAAPQVVAALPGMTPENLQAVLSQRGDPGAGPAIPAGHGRRRGGHAWPAPRPTGSRSASNSATGGGAGRRS